MSFDLAVLKTRLESLALDGKSPDQCFTRESIDYPGHFDFVFQLREKTVGIVRLKCSELHRHEMHTKVLREMEQMHKDPGGTASGSILP